MNHAEAKAAPADLSAVTLLRIGANPQGTRLTLWLRNIALLKPENRISP